VKIPLSGEDSRPVCSENVPMRISLRHLASARLLMLLAGARNTSSSWNSAGGDGGWNLTEDWN
jgi:hypothetical protein